jgi:hypothetical protein
VAELFRIRFGSSTPMIETNFETAEFIKYMNNCYFATKVSFMNEMNLSLIRAMLIGKLLLMVCKRRKSGTLALSRPRPRRQKRFWGKLFPQRYSSTNETLQSLWR